MRPISREEALQFLNAGGEDFEAVAASLSANFSLPKVVTFSKNVFIPLTNACRNACAYCGFRSEKPGIMTKSQVVEILKRGAAKGCKEVLFTFGEKPEEHPAIKEQLRKWGYVNVLEYLYELCEEALSLGLLPHSNPGVITKQDMERLKQVNASLGLMLENISDRLCGKGMPHERSPGKNPRLRLRVIENAGKLKIPFTTGLLVGIGETYEEILDSLIAIKKLNEKYNHIQEVIIQNFKPKQGTPMEAYPEPSVFKMLKIFILARMLMPEMSLQVPPNLNPAVWQIFLLHGANDLGGVSPVTKDYVNPEAEWPRIERMKNMVEELGMKLKERLPIYPRYVVERLYPERMEELVERYADKDGLVKE